MLPLTKRKEDSGLALLLGRMKWPSRGGSLAGDTIKWQQMVNYLVYYIFATMGVDFLLQSPKCLGPSLDKLQVGAIVCLLLSPAKFLQLSAVRMGSKG